MLEKEKAEFERLKIESEGFREKLANEESKRAQLDAERNALITLVRTGTVEPNQQATGLNEITLAKRISISEADVKVLAKSKSKVPECVEEPKRKKSTGGTSSSDDKKTLTAKASNSLQMLGNGIMKYFNNNNKESEGKKEPGEAFLKSL